jgi:HK97 family phage major capsid protein
VATIQTPTSAWAFRPDIPTFHVADIVPDAIIMQCSTISGVIQGDAPSVRVGYVVDDDADFVDEAAPTPQSTSELAEVEIYTKRISQFEKISREQYFNHREGTPEQLSMSVRRALVKKSDLSFLAQPAPTPPATGPAAGLINVDGIVEGDEVLTDLDPLIDLQAQLQANGGTPTHWVVHPFAWAELRKLKTNVSDSSESLIGAGTTDATPMLLSLPVLVNKNCPAYTGLLIDKAAVVSAVGQVTVETSLDRFIEEFAVALVATWRQGQNIVRPDRVGKFTVAAPGS